LRTATTGAVVKRRAIQPTIVKVRRICFLPLLLPLKLNVV